MAAHAGDLSLVFAALADPTRRGLVQRLGRGPSSMTALAKPFALSLPTIFGHLEVLVTAGLVLSRKQGRVRTFTLRPETLTKAEDWLSQQRQLWQTRLDQLD